MKTDAEIMALLPPGRSPTSIAITLLRSELLDFYRRAFRDGAEASSGSAMRGAFAERERDEARMAYTMLRTAVANALTDFEDGDEEALQQLRELLGTNQEAT